MKTDIFEGKYQVIYYWQRDYVTATHKTWVNTQNEAREDTDYWRRNGPVLLQPREQQ